MTWFGIFLIVYWALNALLYIAYVGKTMRFTSTAAVTMVITYALLIWGLVAVGTGQP